MLNYADYGSVSELFFGYCKTMDHLTLKILAFYIIGKLQVLRFECQKIKFWKILNFHPYILNFHHIF